MKKLSLALLISFITITADITKTPPVLNIQVVEGRTLLQESDKGKEIENTLKNKKQQLENEIKGLQQKLQAEVTALQSKAKLIDAETLEREQDKIMKLQKEFELKMQQSQEEFQRKVNIELAKFQKEVSDTIKEEAIKNGWDLVFMKESGEIIYQSGKCDSTKDVLKILNKKHSESKKVNPTAQKSVAQVAQKPASAVAAK